MSRYEVHRFVGLVDGRESWSKVYGPAWGRDTAEKEVSKLKGQYPEARFRIRKSRRSGGRA